MIASSVGSFNILNTPTITTTEDESAPVVTLATSATTIAEDAGSSLTLTAIPSQVADEDVTVSIPTSEPQLRVQIIVQFWILLFQQDQLQEQFCSLQQMILLTK